jgi:uncharacterized membrane protein YphA (DoxX/SURF4 family)
MEKYNYIALLFTRTALAAGFLSAVCSRLNLWGRRSSGWQDFVAYTAAVNSFLPKSFAPTLAVISTVLEIGVALTLLIGFEIQWVALSAFILLMLFAIAMTISSGVKEPLDYSVFAAAGAALLLATTK